MRSGRASRAIPVISASTASKSPSRDRCAAVAHGPPEVPVRRMQQAHQQASPAQVTEPPAASAGFPETIHQKTLVLSGKLWKLW